jgi:predicted nucleic acid-binding protein
MDKFLVDTNIIIYHLNGTPVATDWLLCRQEDLAISLTPFILTDTPKATL